MDEYEGWPEEEERYVDGSSTIGLIAAGFVVLMMVGVVTISKLIKSLSRLSK